MAATKAQVGNIRRDVPEAIRSHWVLFLIQGLIMAAFGLIAAIEPIVATIAVEIFAGWLFLIGGIIGLASAFTAQRVPGYWWSLLTAVLSIAASVYHGRLQAFFPLRSSLACISPCKGSHRSSPRSNTAAYLDHGSGWWSVEWSISSYPRSSCRAGRARRHGRLGYYLASTFLCGDCHW